MQRAPVSTIERIACDKTQRCRDWLTIILSDDDKQIIGHGLANKIEKRLIEIALMARTLEIGALVTDDKKMPYLRGYLGTVKSFNV